MTYFLVGDSSPLQLKYEEVLKEIKTSNVGIKVEYFDFSQNEIEFFIERVSQNSMFQPKEIFVVKRLEKIKKADKFLKIFENFEVSHKEIIFMYEEIFDDYDRRVDEVGSEMSNKKKKLLETFSKIGKLILARSENQKKINIFYIMENLKIDEKSSTELLEIIGTDFFIIKNEIEKIKIYLGNDNYSLEKIYPILTKTNDYNINKLLEKFISNLSLENLLEVLEKDKLYLKFIHSLFSEILLLYKLKILEKNNRINLNISYNDFKIIYPNIEKFFLNEFTMRPIHSYQIFLKIKNAKFYKIDFLKKIIGEIGEVEYRIKSGETQPEIEVPLFLMNFIKEKSI